MEPNWKLECQSIRKSVFDINPNQSTGFFKKKREALQRSRSLEWPGVFEFIFLEVPIVWQKELFRDREAINRLLFSTWDFSQSPLPVCLASKCEESSSLMHWKGGVRRHDWKNADASTKRVIKMLKNTPEKPNAPYFVKCDTPSSYRAVTAL